MRDIRWLFLVVPGVIVGGLVLHVSQPVPPGKSVRQVYDFIENLDEGSTVLLAMDFDPQAKAELEPMSLAILRHCMRRNLKVIGMTFWYTGNAFANELFARVGEEFPDKQVGRDYVYLGYKPGGFAQVITAMAENITGIFKQDYANTSTAGMPVFQEVRSLKDVDYLIDLAAGNSPGFWIKYAGDKYTIEMAVGCTAVSGPDMFARLDTGQINGLIAGMRGAAEYEALIDHRDLGTDCMFAQSLIHVLVIGLVIAGNVLYFRKRPPKPRERDT